MTFISASIMDFNVSKPKKPGTAHTTRSYCFIVFCNSPLWVTSSNCVVSESHLFNTLKFPNSIRPGITTGFQGQIQP